MGTQFSGSNRDGTTQAVAYTGTAAASATAFGGYSRRVRIASNSACHYTVAAVPVAVVTDPFLPANTVLYITVSPSEKISAIRAATAGLITATDGTLWVTEVS